MTSRAEGAAFSDVLHGHPELETEQVESEVSINLESFGSLIYIESTFVPTKEHHLLEYLNEIVRQVI